MCMCVVAVCDMYGVSGKSGWSGTTLMLRYCLVGQYASSSLRRDSTKFRYAFAAGANSRVY